MPLNKLIEKLDVCELNDSIILKKYRQAAEDVDGFLHTNEKLSNPEVD